MSEKVSNIGLKSLQTLKDCRRVEDVDFSQLEIIRGKTPDDIVHKCLKLCQQYLSGVWLKQTDRSICVKRLTGGLTNQLYLCSINTNSIKVSENNLDDNNCVPLEVVIRLYGSKYINIIGDTNERLSDIMVALMASQCGLSPKTYGLFDDGEILAYYKHRPFGIPEQQNTYLVQQVFSNLAKFHSMQVPVRRDPNWLHKMLDQFYDSARHNLDIDLLANELNCETFMANDIGLEKKWIKQLIHKTQSPIVFIHNDFRSSNIMIVNNGDNDSEGSVNGRVVFCDFDASCYGYRGLDFGSIFYEWGRTWDTMKDLHQLPDDSTIIPVIDIYLTQCKQIYGQTYSENPINSVPNILKEIKRFVLVNALLMILTNIRCDPKLMQTLPVHPKLLMQFQEISYKNYWHLKKQFLLQDVL